MNIVINVTRYVASENLFFFLRNYEQCLTKIGKTKIKKNVKSQLTSTIEKN